MLFCGEIISVCVSVYRYIMIIHIPTPAPPKQHHCVECFYSCKILFSFLPCSEWARADVQRHPGGGVSCQPSRTGHQAEGRHAGGAGAHRCPLHHWLGLQTQSESVLPVELFSTRYVFHETTCLCLSTFLGTFSESVTVMGGNCLQIQGCPFLMIDLNSWFHPCFVILVQKLPLNQLIMQQMTTGHWVDLERD